MDEPNKQEIDRRVVHHDLLAALVRQHAPHHACEHQICGLWMIVDLAIYDYRLSPGTLSPMLHRVERDGYLTSRRERSERMLRKFYRITDRVREGLAVANRQVREFREEAE